jgi:hypothetical protein
MVRAAPLIDVRVVRFVRRFEPRADAIADVVRATGGYCERIGVTRPSYEQVRVLVHGARERRGRRRAAAKLLLEVDLRARPPSDLLHLLDDARRAPPPSGC